MHECTPSTKIQAKLGHCVDQRRGELGGSGVTRKRQLIYKLETPLVDSFAPWVDTKGSPGETNVNVVVAFN